jgi:hypothetical protein
MGRGLAGGPNSLKRSLSPLPRLNYITNRLPDFCSLRAEVTSSSGQVVVFTPVVPSMLAEGDPLTEIIRSTKSGKPFRIAAQTDPPFLHIPSLIHPCGTTTGGRNRTIGFRISAVQRKILSPEYLSSTTTTLRMLFNFRLGSEAFRIFAYTLRLIAWWSPRQHNSQLKARSLSHPLNLAWHRIWFCSTSTIRDSD